MKRQIHVHVYTTDVHGEFKESDHPRAKNGQFGSGGGGGSGKKSAQSSEPAAKSGGKSEAEIEAETNAQVAAEAKKHKLQGLPKAREKRVERQTQSQVRQEQAKVANAKGNSPASQVSAAQREAANKIFKAEQAAAEKKAHRELTSHPNYNKEDHEYLVSKGWTAGEIKERWDEEKKEGKQASGNKYTNPVIKASANITHGRSEQSEKLLSGYKEYAKSKGLDPQARTTMVQYARKEGLNPNVTESLEAGMKIGQKAKDKAHCSCGGH
jgi:hypothetical protein